MNNMTQYAQLALLALQGVQSAVAIYTEIRKAYALTMTPEDIAKLDAEYEALFTSPHWQQSGRKD